MNTAQHSAVFKIFSLHAEYYNIIHVYVKYKPCTHESTKIDFDVTVTQFSKNLLHYNDIHIVYTRIFYI